MYCMSSVYNIMETTCRGVVKFIFALWGRINKTVSGFIPVPYSGHGSFKEFLLVFHFLIGKFSGSL